MTDVQRDIGAHGEAIKTLKDEVSALRDDVAEIKAMVAASKGGLQMCKANEPRPVWCSIPAILRNRKHR